jgi:tRNA A58 N-methylase Trm61
MTQKAMANVQKLLMIYCGIRESLADMMEEETDQDGATGVNFQVLAVDVQAAWDLVQHSMHTMKHFKVRN